MSSTPSQLNIGSGRFFFLDYLNVDIHPQWEPDILCDITKPLFDDQKEHTFESARFGTITLKEACMDKIIAWHILEHLPDLVCAMTNMLKLLKTGGILHIRVPYELSLGAWQDPTHVRAFNENSWIYYTQWFWYLDWTNHRFQEQNISYVPSEIGRKMLARGAKIERLLLTPRAIDEMDITLQKIEVSAEERAVLTQKKVHKIQSTEIYKR